MKKKMTEQQILFNSIEVGDLTTTKKIIFQNRNIINERNEYKFTSLHKACYHGKWRIAKLLINNGADVNAKNYVGFTPLRVACQRGHLRIIRLLVDSGADVNIFDGFGSAFFYACHHGETRIIKLLVESGADVTAKDKNGNAPLDVLLRKYPQKYNELTEWLMENYPDKMLEHMSEQTKQGYTL